MRNNSPDSKGQPANGDDLGHDPTKSGVAKLIDWSVKNQLLVIVGVLALLVAGLISIEKNLAGCHSRSL